MHREDDSNYLLYIEPPAHLKSKEPLEDEWVELMNKAISAAEIGAAFYDDLTGKVTFETDTLFMGFHQTECGEWSKNYDLRLENGMITNSLAPFYLQYYRQAIPASEWRKLEKLKTFYEGKLMES